MDAIIHQLSQTIRKAAASKTPLCVRGGGTKDFYGGPLCGETLSAAAYRGVVQYEPPELVITARAGTPLVEIETLLREKGQMLAFEPPHFAEIPSPVAPPTLTPDPSPDGRGEANVSLFPPREGSGIRDGEGNVVPPERKNKMATLGGCIAAGLSGPRRAYAGAVRDLVLGVRMLNGKGSDLRFGGQVMKNVAGYDISRLMAGSLGTLGVILDVSLKVLPLPVAEITLRREQTQAEAVALMNELAGRPLPISASCHFDNLLYLRLSGARAAVRAARDQLGGEEIADGTAFWEGVREQKLGFFESSQPLWRLSVKSTTPPLNLPGQQLIEWGGALRWLKSGADAQSVREAAEFGGGHATLFRGGDKSVGVFHPPQPALRNIHTRLKQTFDPAGILNPGRLYDWM